VTYQIWFRKTCCGADTAAREKAWIIIQKSLKARCGFMARLAVRGDFAHDADRPFHLGIISKNQMVMR
jgi:hypothetical protein